MTIAYGMEPASSDSASLGSNPSPPATISPIKSALNRHRQDGQSGTERAFQTHKTRHRVIAAYVATWRAGPAGCALAHAGLALALGFFGWSLLPDPAPIVPETVVTRCDDCRYPPSKDEARAMHD